MNGNQTSNSNSNAVNALWQMGSKSACRALVADDDAPMLEIHVEVLKRAGLEVDTALDGAIAWDFFQTKRYDLLVTDNSMPKISGVELVKMVRTVNRNLPIIMVTAELPTNELARNPALAINVILLKPYTRASFLETLKQVLPNRG